MSKPFDPLDPLAFDPLAALEEMTGKKAAPAPAPAVFEVPLDLDALANPHPGETPQALLARSAALARAAAVGPHLRVDASPARAVRSKDDPARHGPPDPATRPVVLNKAGQLVRLKNVAPPYPFDDSDPHNLLAIAILAIPATSQKTAFGRVKAAKHLTAQYEQRHKAPLPFADCVRWWWLVARQCVDLAGCFGRPGLSPSTVRRFAYPAVAHDFAEAKDIPFSMRAAAFESAGVPMPRDKHGNPTLPKDYPRTWW